MLHFKISLFREVYCAFYLCGIIRKMTASLKLSNETGSSSWLSTFLQRLYEVSLPETCDPLTLIEIAEQSGIENTINSADIYAYFENDDAKTIINVLVENNIINVNLSAFDKLQNTSNHTEIPIFKTESTLSTNEELELFKKLEAQIKTALTAIFHIPKFHQQLEKYLRDAVLEKRSMKEYFDFSKMSNEIFSETESDDDELSEEKSQKNSQAEDNLIKQIQVRLSEVIEGTFDTKETNEIILPEEKINKIVQFLIDELPPRKKTIDSFFHTSHGISARLNSIHKKVFDVSDFYLPRPKFLKHYLKNETSGSWKKVILDKAQNRTKEQINALEQKLDASIAELTSIEDEFGMTLHDLKEANKKINRSAKKIKNQYTSAYKHNVGLIRFCLKKLKVTRQHNEAFEDFCMEGSIYLIKAIEKFNYRRGNKFSTYATNWILAGIRKGLNMHCNTVHVPTHIKQEITRLNKIKHKLWLDYEIGGPSDEDIAAEAGIDPSRVKFLLSLNLKSFSIDHPASGSGDEEDRSLITTIADENSESPEDAYRVKQIQEIVRKILSKLSPFEEEVLCYQTGIYWDYRLTLQDIGRKFKLSPENIRLVIGRARKKILEDATNMCLADELRNEYDIELADIF